MVRKPRSGGRQTGTSMYSVATQRAQGRKKPWPARLPAPHGDSSRSSRRVPRRQGNVTTTAKAGVRLEIPNGAVLENKGLTVKQEDQATDNDFEAVYTSQAHATYNNHSQFLC